MDKETPIEPDKEILDIFKELKEKAKALNPNLLSDIKSFYAIPEKEFDALIPSSGKNGAGSKETALID